ncbi:Medium-chain-fatty-acid--CoA ligase [Termitomyces sp. J132]|nr:Medium-chain-fatty-acid--CoA ligase [Termitomyces sp. J132]
MSSTFTPTPASIPPVNAVIRLRQPSNLPIHIHPLNPLDFLLRAAQIYPDKVALVHSDVEHPVSYTFAVWAQRVQNLAYALIAAGIKPGDRVAVIAPNSPLIADAHHGIIAARAIIVPVNTRLKPHEVAYILQHSGASLVLVDYECIHLIQGTQIPFIISNDTGRSGDPYETFLTSGRKFSAERGWLGLDTEADENTPSTLCYTSGTTGRPKGIYGCSTKSTLRVDPYPGSYLAAIANAHEGQMNRHSVYLWILPMFHAAGWTFPWASVFAYATQANIGIINDPSARKPPQPVTAIIAGAAPTPHLIAGLETIGITPVHVYGLTETYGPFTRNYEQDSWSKLSLEQRSKYMARQGHAFATAQDVRVVYQPGEHAKEDELIDVPRDGKTLGEIVTRGNIVVDESMSYFHKYFNDPEATAKAFRGGAFRSGDLAVWYPDGSVSIMDRSKDIIISGGENASSLAIEQELASHPHILEVTVVARSHPKWGERPMAFVVLHPQHTAKWAGRHKQFADELKEHAKARLPGFARPEWVEVVPDLPKTSTGKILKSELRKVVAKL